MDYGQKIIPFNQSYDLIPLLDINKNKTLIKYVRRFGGLCDFICNRILMDNSLGRGNNENSIRKRITVERIDEDNIKKSHLLDVYSVFQKMLAYLFGIYPDNIFSCSNQWKLVNKTSNSINREILDLGLKGVMEGETLKLEVFSRRGLKLSGHSLLIKKMGNDKYIFFDPNRGEHRDLSFDELSDKIDAQLQLQKGTDIFLTKGEDYLKRLEKKHINTDI